MTQKLNAGSGSLALAIQMADSIPGAKLCLVSHNDGHAIRPVRAALMVSVNPPCWIEADGMHALESVRGLGPVIREANTADLGRILGQPQAADLAVASELIISDQRLVAALSTAQRIIAEQEARNVEQQSADSQWRNRHADAPAEAGPGWETLLSIADYATYMLSSDMDEDAAEWFDALSVPERVRVLYTRSDCDNFAVALHRVTGWPIVVAAFPDPDVGLGHHTLVQAPDGRMLDAAGWHEAAKLKRRLGKGKTRFSEPGGEETAMSASIGETLEEHAGMAFDADLARAVSAIRQLPWAPYDSAEFRLASLRPLPGVDLPLPADDAEPDPHHL